MGQSHTVQGRHCDGVRHCKVLLSVGNETPAQCVTSWLLRVSKQLHDRGLTCEGARLRVDHLLRRVTVVVDGHTVESCEPREREPAVVGLHRGETCRAVLEFKEPSAYIPGWAVTSDDDGPACKEPAEVMLKDLELVPLLGVTRLRRRRCRARPEP